MKKLLALALCVLLLTGCTYEVPETTAPSEPEYIGSSPVPNIRTGIYRQGISTFNNGFESTDTGYYFLYTSMNGTYLLYGEHDSDTIIKLCGRPDCAHDNRSCNACFDLAFNVCYYEGHLYVLDVAGGGVVLYRIDPDGTNRVKVMDTASLSGYNGSYAPIINNGMLHFALTKLDESGNQIYHYYYYKLDGSMEEPERAPDMAPTYCDGYNQFLSGESSTGEPRQGLYLWDTEANEAVYLTDKPEQWAYWATESAYYVDDGIIYQSVYGESEAQVVFDTGLRGELRLHGFPDCFVLSRDNYEESKATWSETLFFYDWEFNSFGQVELDYPVYFDINYNMICGETENRIYLAAHSIGIPEYYIDKSDFDSGHIKLHPLTLPDDIEKEFQYKEEDAAPWEE